MPSIHPSLNKQMPSVRMRGRIRQLQNRLDVLQGRRAPFVPDFNVSGRVRGRNYYGDFDPASELYSGEYNPDIFRARKKHISDAFANAHINRASSTINARVPQSMSNAETTDSVDPSTYIGGRRDTGSRVNMRAANNVYKSRSIVRPIGLYGGGSMAVGPLKKYYNARRNFRKFKPLGGSHWVAPNWYRRRKFGFTFGR